MTRYFAYGSNMSASVMATACPGNILLGRAQLPRHRIAFTRRSVRTGTGVADIVADEDGVVWGVLYELGTDELDALDRKEGAGWAYERREVTALTDDGAPHKAIAYVVITKSSAPIEPSGMYVERLIDAGHERGLPAAHLDAIRRAGAGRER